MSFPKKDGDQFVGNMGDRMILMGGTFYLYDQFDADKEKKAKKDEAKERRSAERSSDKTE